MFAQFRATVGHLRICGNLSVQPRFSFSLFYLCPNLCPLIGHGSVIQGSIDTYGFAVFFRLRRKSPRPTCAKPLTSSGGVYGRPNLRSSNPHHPSSTEAVSFQWLWFVLWCVWLFRNNELSPVNRSNIATILPWIRYDMPLLFAK